MDIKVQIDELSPYERRLKIEVPYQNLEEEMEKQFASLSKRVNISGFRPGKVPLDIIRQKYYGQVLQESVSHVVEASYLKALSERHIIAVSEPRIKMEPLAPMKDRGPVSYTVQLEVKPKIEPKKYTGLSLEKEKISIEDSQIDRAIEELRQRQGELRDIPEPRGVRDKDFAVIDFKGTVEGKEFPGGSAKNFLYEMGSKQFVEGFEEGLLGLQKGGQKKIQVVFPNDFHEKRLAGKGVIFEVELREIKEKEVPKLDDAFASGFGGCKTVSDLRAWVQKDLASYEENRVQKNLETVLIKALVQENPITVPPSMIRQQTEFLEKDTEERFRKMGLEGEKLTLVLEKIRKDIPGKAEEDVKAMLLIEAVSEREKIEVIPEEFEREYEQIAKRAGTTAKEVRAYFEKEGRVSGLHWQILQFKVIQWLISKSKIKERNPSSFA